MQGSAILGVNVKDDTFATADQAIGLWRAGAAITCGHTCIIDTAVATGKQAVSLTASGTAHDEHLIVGAYANINGQCIGGTGAETSTTSLTGRAAVTGDYVVLTSGPTLALVEGTTDVVVKDRLMAHTTAGQLMKATTDAALGGALAGLYPAYKATALVGQTANSAVAVAVFIIGY